MALSIRTVEYMESLLWKYFHIYMESVPTGPGYSGMPENHFADFIGPYRQFLTQQEPDDYSKMHESYLLSVIPAPDKGIRGQAPAGIQM